MNPAMRRVTHWVDGKPWGGGADRTGRIFDPATGQETGTVDLASAADVDAAVQAAAAAFPAWRAGSLRRRTDVLFAFRNLARRHRAELARIITAEHGKVHADALGEVDRGLEVAEFACGIPHLLKGEFSENVSTGVDSHSVRQPVAAGRARCSATRTSTGWTACAPTPGARS